MLCLVSNKVHVRIVAELVFMPYREPRPESLELLDRARNHSWQLWSWRSAGVASSCSSGGSCGRRIEVRLLRCALHVLTRARTLAALQI